MIESYLYGMAPIANGNWQDPCCDLKEQLTAWAKEKNITV